ncbi:hypothetical protein [Soonwooa sp.]|uniref:hypothetical protein n=1 Tax=Soonwooa sp. TaxID=1938592 RepID=UPI00289E35D9|nr:hypothetical protein [Soonwooa sp.]
MSTSLSLLDEVSRFFNANTLELDPSKSITLEELTNYEFQLLEVEVQEGVNNTTEAIGSMLEELKKGSL